jgi:hypothetical protein
MASPARLLSPSSILVHRIHLPTVDSTNSWAKRNAGALDPLQLTAITAGSQTAGRGRGSRVWVSSGDDIALTLAFFLPPASVPSAYLLSPLLCVAARRALLAPPPSAFVLNFQASSRQPVVQRTTTTSPQPLVW